ncbi:response regulator [Mesorhizobium sp. CO1-1-8]|uniref:response regulator n=1 Tax=Mesorhizobium sp. CO1-1-8 TaxID=2876631 RepID=UPI001CD0C964|nr:response regulator [Mesorhizobium sp. CO1-1-8]MBZ9773974.1 response regulator [Mesorhizobium sp. CO1-1-8]
MRLETAMTEPSQAGELDRAFKPQLAFSRDDMGAGQATPMAGRSILIVEDDYLIALDAEAGLTAAGFSLVGTAVSAEQAISIAVSTRPALVLMDIRLLGKRDGIDAALELYRDHGIRCIFTTAHGDHEVRLRAEAARPLGWVQKPYSIIALVEAIRTGLQQLEQQN